MPASAIASATSGDLHRVRSAHPRAAAGPRHPRTPRRGASRRSSSATVSSTSKPRARQAGPGQIGGAFRPPARPAAARNPRPNAASGPTVSNVSHSGTTPGQRQQASGGLQPDQIVPGRRNPHRSAGIRPDRRRGQPEGDRGRRPRGRPARHRTASLMQGGVAVTGFSPRPENASSDIWVLPRQTSPCAGGRLPAPRRRVSGMRPFSKRRPGLGRHACRVEQILPADRHAVQQPACACPALARAAAAIASARARRGRGAGIDARRQRDGRRSCPDKPSVSSTG